MECHVEARRQKKRAATLRLTERGFDVTFVADPKKKTAAAAADSSNNSDNKDDGGTAPPPAYSVRWSDVFIACPKPNFQIPSQIVFDCIPQGEGPSPLLLKFWLPHLADLGALRTALENENASRPDGAARIVVGKSAIWSTLSSTTFLPFYRRWLSDVYRSGCLVLEVLVIAVSVFMLLDLLGFHDPGLAAHGEFSEKAREILRVGETDFDRMQVQMQRAVQGLSKTDRALVNERWQEFGWGPTFYQNSVVFRQEEALEALRDKDYLARYSKLLFAGISDAAWVLYRTPYLSVLSRHPYLLLVGPLLLPVVVGAGLLAASALFFCGIFFSIRHLSVLLLSFNATLLLKQVVFDARAHLSYLKALLKMSTGMVRFSYTTAKRLYNLAVKAGQASDATKHEKAE